MDNLLEVRNLKKYFPRHRGLLQRTVGYVKAVDGISFEVRRGETLGLVGESGCGKSTTGLSILRLIEPTDGEVWFHNGGERANLCSFSRRQLKAIRGRMQIIFQDPDSSLNPRMTVGDIVGEPLRVNKIARGAELEDRVSGFLERVGLHAHDMRRYPHAFSGGQRQRIGIARALALQPDLVIADEPVSALDVSVQAQILNLLAELREQFSLSYILITHDLSVVEHLSDRVAVMYLGRIVEVSDTDTLYQRPRHPYTEALLSAIPIPDPREQRARKRLRLEGDVPDPSDPPPGCSFHPRCRYAKKVCRCEVPQLREVSNTAVACHLCDDLSLQGIHNA